MVKGNKIHAIDSTGKSTYGNYDLHIDGKNKYLIPGLWDMHTHSTQHSPWLHHPLYISNGVTAIRDMSGQMGKKDSYWAGTLDRLEWNRKLESNVQITPRYALQSSYQINGSNSVPGSFPDFFKMEQVEDVDKLLAHYSEEGTDFIKVYSEIPAHTYKLLAGKAEEYGMHVAGHKPLQLSLENALYSGQRSFEHGRIFMFECYPGSADLRESDDPYVTYKQAKPEIAANFDFEHASALMDIMAERKSYWTPTFQTLKSSVLADDTSFLDDPLLIHIPKMQKLLWWNPDIGSASKYNNSKEGRLVNQKLYELAKVNVGMAHERGVPILAGTDITDSYTFAGFSLHNELKELKSCGLTNLEVLRSATIVPAEYCDLEEELGSVEIGKLADLVILEENPLTDISNTQTILGVFLNGNFLNKEVLDDYEKATAQLAGTFHMNVKYLASLLGSPLMRKQLAD